MKSNESYQKKVEVEEQKEISKMNRKKKQIRQYTFCYKEKYNCQIYEKKK